MTKKEKQRKRLAKFIEQLKDAGCPFNEVYLEVSEFTYQAEAIAIMYQVFANIEKLDFTKPEIKLDELQ